METLWWELSDEQWFLRTVGESHVVHQQCLPRNYDGKSLGWQRVNYQKRKIRFLASQSIGKCLLVQKLSKFDFLVHKRCSGYGGLVIDGLNWKTWKQRNDGNVGT